MCPKILLDVLETFARQKELSWLFHKWKQNYSKCHHHSAYVPARPRVTISHLGRGGQRIFGFCFLLMLLFLFDLSRYEKPITLKFSPEKSFPYYWTMTWKFISTRKSMVSGVKGDLSKVRSGKHCPDTWFAHWCRRGNWTLITMAYLAPCACCLMVQTQPALWKHTKDCKGQKASTWKDEGKHTAISRKSLNVHFMVMADTILHGKKNILHKFSLKPDPLGLLNSPSWLPRRQLQFQALT